MIGVGKAKQYGNVLDKPLAKGKQEVSLSAFAFLFSELVQYNQTQVDNIGELERRLEDAGYAVGARVLELLCHRDKGNRRETRLLGILSFVHSTVWKVLFGKVADSLEKGTEHEDEYMISEKELLVNKFISIPKDMGTFNCGAFVAGIVRFCFVSSTNEGRFGWCRISGCCNCAFCAYGRSTTTTDDNFDKIC
ncbi:trafficking protein particle complex subunit 5 isoform X2 [Vigna radiata var. radiata]|uniref:Trafficking protein particle complex subunit 5 isoform X2 n=1 Tax=Vigna radiata var. radiata TaxID=3916 RepID=A0A3Q0ETS9_VIGRR|nr:trafficking protein particle complex subunit 5 isoform X2 [Vigna radiata var. radiata]